MLKQQLYKAAVVELVLLLGDFHVVPTLLVFCVTAPAAASLQRLQTGGVV